MEKELDLTLRLGLPSPAVETHLSLDTSSTTNQRINIDGGPNDGGETHGRRHILGNENEPDERHVDVNTRYYNLVFNHFAGIGETLNFAPFPIQPSPYSFPVTAPETPRRSDYVLFDVPARRAVRNSITIENAPGRNANLKQRRGCGGCCGWMKRCTNQNCNAINTPMWRRGPLGPKTLCNACGIKFRKEEDRRSKRTC